MQRILSVVASLFSMLTLVACGGALEPYDCSQGVAALSGVIEVEQPVGDVYIVVLRPSADEALRAEGRDVRADAIRSIAGDFAVREVRPLVTIDGFAAAMDAADARRIAADPRVAFVQRDGRKSIPPAPRVPAAGPVPAPARAASWGLDRIDQRNRPLDGDYRPDGDGAGVHAYVIDTGVEESHEEFRGRIGEGHDVYGGRQRDGHGHGTHVAGTLAGAGFGVATAVVVHGVRVLDNDGRGTDSRVIEGIDWAAAHVTANGWPAVANMSLGGGPSPAIDLAVCRSLEAGLLQVIAAGNDDRSACAGSPSRVGDALVVGASNRDDRRAFFSDTGPCVSVFAPGQDIVSARRGGGSTTLSGTSMASPHAAGVAALCLGRDGGRDAAAVKACVVDNASESKLRDVPGNTPNLLVFAGPEGP